MEVTLMCPVKNEKDSSTTMDDIDCLVQDSSISIANALEIL